AEDGIRDFHVTGVQTCALRSLALPSLNESLSHRELVSLFELELDLVEELGQSGLAEDHGECLTGGGQVDGGILHGRVPLHLPQRSEERRVGKECRSRWSPSLD